MVLSKRTRKTIQILADAHHDSNNKTAVVDCFELGRATLQGQGLELTNPHLFYNYQFYASHTFKKYDDKEILVIRTEHLWRDTNELNRLLLLDTDGSDATTEEEFLPEGLVRSYGSEQYPVKSGLSKLGKVVFCCFLIDEIQIFRDLTWQAANLDDLEKQKYLDGLYDDCGVPTEARIKDFSWTTWRETSCWIT